MAELADAYDSDSYGITVQVQVLFGAPIDSNFIKNSYIVVRIYLFFRYRLYSAFFE